jgi:type IV secretion system protein VirD4
MTRAPSAAGSHSVGKYLGAVLLAATAGLYLSGYGFLRWIKQPAATEEPLAPLLAPIQYGRWYAEIGEDKQEKLLRSLAVGMGLAFGGAAWLLWPRPRPLHGDARFATRREIATVAVGGKRRVGLLGHRGIILGKLGNRYLMLPGQQGVLLEAPPRSGKGVGFVIPNLLALTGSVIVNDIKKENRETCAGWLEANGWRVVVIDPLSYDECSDLWNPCEYVSDIPWRRLDDLHRIAWLRFPNPTTGNPFWAAGARCLFLGVALWCFETEGVQRTLGEILRRGMACDGEGFKAHWARLIARATQAGYPLDPITELLLRESSDLAPQTVSSIRKEFTSGLELWLNPMIDATTSGNTFDLRNLRQERVAIFLLTDPDNLERLQPFRNLFFQQAIGLNARQLPKGGREFELMLMLDELTSLGRVPALIDLAAYLPGYNIRICAVVQAYSQLIEIYGEQGAKTLRKMLAARIVFPSNDDEDAEAISRGLGTYTVRVQNTSRPAFFGNGRGQTISSSDQPRRLLLPNEVKELGSERLLLYYENLRVVLGGRVRFYEERVFRKRLLPPPSVPALDIAGAMRRITRIPQKEPAMHTVTAADVPTLGQKKLTDFAGDFDAIAVPAGQLSDAQVQGVVDGFLATLAA